jgi:hypothetical protein
VRWTTAVVVAVIFFQVSCSKSDSLSRDQAAKLINSSPKFKARPARILLSKDDVERGVANGFWTINTNPIFGEYVDLTPEGKKLFKGFEPQLTGERILDLKDSLPLYVVAVTGITDESSTGQKVTQKSVEFTANYKLDQADPTVHAFLVDLPAGKGGCAFQLYDDGWRIGDCAFLPQQPQQPGEQQQ